MQRSAGQKGIIMKAGIGPLGVCARKLMCAWTFECVSVVSIIKCLIPCVIIAGELFMSVYPCLLLSNTLRFHVLYTL